MRENVILRVYARARGARLVRLRLRLAVPLVWLASKIAGTGFEVDVE